MKRQLATIRRINSLQPIPGADRIELAQVDGWQSVVRKGEFVPGDVVVYCEIDSFLPIRPEYEFLRSSSYRKMEDGTEGFRVRTTRMRGTLSQGLIFNLDILPKDSKTYYLGQDVTEVLGIRKWIPILPVALEGQIRRRRPIFVPDGDMPRIQNIIGGPKELHFEATEKVDGSNMSVYYCDGDIGVTSHTNDLLLDQEGNTFVDVARAEGLLDIVKDLKRNITLKGELCGPKIQSNTLGLPNLRFLLFNIWDIDKGRYLLRDERNELIAAFCKPIHQVPVIQLDPGQDQIFKWTTQEILDFATRPSLVPSARKQAEGIVFKSTELFNGQMYMFKAINNERLS